MTGITASQQKVLSYVIPLKYNNIAAASYIMLRINLAIQTATYFGYSTRQTD